jgi:hypothetical protein
MSLILDALRNGRPRATPRQDLGTQPDAVLHTLGYTRPEPTSLFGRIKRVTLYSALAVFAVLTIWGLAIWYTGAYLNSAP